MNERWNTPVMIGLALTFVLALCLINFGRISGHIGNYLGAADRQACLEDIRPRLEREVYRQAIDACTAAIQAGDTPVSSMPILYRQRAFLRMQTREYGQAVQDWDQAIQRDPEGPATYLAYHHRGQSHAAMGEPQQAVADYDRALARRPDHVEGLMSRGWARLMMRQPDKALEDYQAVAKLLPQSDVRHHRSLGFGYLRANQCDKALPFLQRALAMNPKEAQHHAWAAECLARLDRLPEALADIDRAIALFRDPVYYGIRAGIHRRMGRLDAVAADYKQIVALDRNATTLNNLCWARAMWGGELKEALADCDEALAQYPEAASFLDSRGFVHFRMGNFRAAIADYDKAIRLRPKSPHSLYIRGLAKKALGDIADGNDDVRAASALYPEIEKEFAPARIVP